jgi:sucrose phosphorylase
MMGVPGIYLHGLLGSKNDADAVLEEGHIRSINRKMIRKKELLAALDDHNSNIFQVAYRLVRLVHFRIREKAFHPNAPQTILSLSDNVFSNLRISLDGDESILSIINITDTITNVTVNLKSYSLDTKPLKDILSKKIFSPENGILHISMEPYEILWLKSKAT